MRRIPPCGSAASTRVSDRTPARPRRRPRLSKSRTIEITAYRIHGLPNSRPIEITAANYCGAVIYIHEQLELQPGKTDDFLARFENDYEPLMADLGARLVHVW